MAKEPSNTVILERMEIMNSDLWKGMDELKTSLQSEMQLMKSDLQQQISGLSNKVTSLEGKVTSLDARVTSLDGKISSSDGRMMSLAARMEQGFQDARLHREALQEDLEATMKTTFQHGKKLQKLT